MRYIVTFFYTKIQKTKKPQNRQLHNSIKKKKAIGGVTKSLSHFPKPSPFKSSLRLNLHETW